MDIDGRAFDLLRPYQFRGKYRLLGKIAPKTGVREAVVHGAKMTLDLSDWMQRNIYLGSYERHETRAVRRWLSAGDTFVDVGANVGYFSVLAAQCVGSSGRVVSFEPSPYAFGRLSETVRRNDLRQVITRQEAVGDKVGALNLYVDPNGGNHTPTALGREDEKPYATVPVTTLDTVVDELGIKRIDLLKIDVEGYETRVLKGGTKALAMTRAVLVEFNEPWLRKAISHSGELWCMLADAGLKGPRPSFGSDGVETVFLRRY